MYWHRNLALANIQKNLIKAFREDPQITADKTILNPTWMDQLIKEAKQRPQEELTKAATIGTRAHGGKANLFRQIELCSHPFYLVFEDLCCGKEIEEPEKDMRPLIEGFLKWKATEPDLHIIDVEQVLHSEKHCYAGTADAIAVRTSGTNSGIVILDWKTSNALHREYAYQAAAYARAWEEMNGATVSEAMVVRFNKFKPEFEARRIHSIEESFQAFLSCLGLYKSQKLAAFADDVPEDDLGALVEETVKTEIDDAHIPHSSANE